MDRPRNSQEAMALALDWAEGRRSHLNEFMGVEPDVSQRAVTLARCAEADAAEAQKWAALAVSMRRLEEGDRAEPGWPVDSVSTAPAVLLEGRFTRRGDMMVLVNEKGSFNIGAAFIQAGLEGSRVRITAAPVNPPGE